MRLKISDVRSFRGLEIVHERHGRESLRMAGAMLHRELDKTEEVKKILPTLAERKIFQKLIVNPKEAKADMQFCDHLIEDLRELGRRA